MISKKFKKLVGLRLDEFEAFRSAGQIHAQEARLIPTLKTGDEMALTSIFLSAVKLVKEYRDGLFRELKLGKAGRVYYYTEVSFPGIDKSRIDGLVMIVVKGVVKEAAFFEMKSKASGIERSQVETYLKIAKQLGVQRMVTVSNEFVADPSHSPVKVRVPKGVLLFHFSWTYLMTRGQLLLFKNEHNIKDEDQVEIMREALAYFESPLSGVSGYVQMKPGWKQLVDSVRAQKPLKVSDSYIEDAVVSWHEEEKDMALILSQKLGVLVRSTPRNADSVKNDIRRLVKHNYITGRLSVKDSVSDIKVVAELERRIVSMSVKITPPMDKGTKGKVSWLDRQLDMCNKRSPDVFGRCTTDIWVEADVKYARENVKVSYSELEMIASGADGREIQAFHVMLSRGFGSNMGSNKKFIELIEQMVLEYYEGIVQHMTNWNRPAPKLSRG